MTDPESRTTRYEYDPDWPRQIKAVRNAENRVIQENSYHPITGWLLTNIAHDVKTVFVHDALGQVTNTLYAAGSRAISVYDGFRLVRTISRTGLTNSFGYDLAGRNVTVTDSLGNVTSNELDAAGNVAGVTSLAALPLPITTRFERDVMNRVTRTILPDGRASTNAYDWLGRLEARTGAGGVPVSYEHDPAGRMTKLVDGEKNATTFEYGCCNLFSKHYADGSFLLYDYDSRNRLSERVDCAAKVTAYRYNNAGQVTHVDYATDPDVFYFHDSLGRMTSRVDAAGTWVWSYDADSGRIVSETLHSLGDGGWTSAVSYSYHPDTYELASVGIDDTHRTFYNWDRGRLVQVSNFQFRVSYQYKEASDLLWRTTYGTGEVVTTRLYDNLNRLTNISTVAGGQVINSFTYTLDSTGRRVARKDADGSRHDYGYDSYDQLISATRTNGPNPAFDAAYRFGYVFDQVGNRLHEDRGQMTLDGSFNSLNQLKQLDWGGKLDVYGRVGGTNLWWTNTVNGAVSVAFDGSNFLGGATLAAGSNVISIVTRADTGTNMQLRTVQMPPTKPQTLLWDANGNLLALHSLGDAGTNDGQRVYSWNEENRLVAVEGTAQGGQPLRTEFLYDGMGRMVRRADLSGWNGTAFGATNVTRYVRDGHRILAELDGDNNLIAYHTWGLDLSQTLDGAGGVGGLLGRTQRSGSSTQQWVYAYCGNGNVQDVLDDSGSVLGSYTYDPFGRQVGFESHDESFTRDSNPWQFSTKQADPIWGLVHYEYRAYSPELRVWPSRDPLGDPRPAGLDPILDMARSRASSVSYNGFLPGPWTETVDDFRLPPFRGISQAQDWHGEDAQLVNLYGFVCNNAISTLDILGLFRDHGQCKTKPCFMFGCGICVSENASCTSCYTDTYKTGPLKGKRFWIYAHAQCRQANGSIGRNFCYCNVPDRGREGSGSNGWYQSDEPPELLNPGIRCDGTRQK